LLPTTHREGTPTKLNSVYDDTPDIVAPYVTSIEVIDKFLIYINFSETINSLVTSDFFVSQGRSIIDLVPTNSDYTQIKASLSPALDAGIIYTLTIDALSDCSKNTRSSSSDFVLPFGARAGDIIINEVLFDPYAGGSDFVELYNRSNRAINLHGLYLANEENGLINNEKSIEL